MAQLLAVLGVAALMESLECSDLNTFRLLVNPFTQYGKVETSVDSMSGTLSTNIFSNAFFNADRKNYKSIVIFGTSIAARIPLITFEYDGQHFRIYNMAIVGNPITPTMKIFSIMAGFRPDIALFVLTPVQTESGPTFLYDPFGRQCLGAIRQYGLPGGEFPQEETCDPSHPATRPFSMKAVIDNAEHLIGSGLGWRDKDFDSRFSRFRSTIAAFGKALENQCFSLLGFQPTKHILAVGNVDLGNLTLDAAKDGRRKLIQAVAAMKNSPNPHPDHAADRTEKWSKRHPNAALKSDGSIGIYYTHIAKLARSYGIRPIFMNAPLAHTTPGMFPVGYYEAYRESLKDLFEQEKVPYLDEGDFLENKGDFWQDTIHLNDDGVVNFSRLIAYDMIVKGVLDDVTGNGAAQKEASKEGRR